MSHEWAKLRRLEGADRTRASLRLLVSGGGPLKVNWRGRTAPWDALPFRPRGAATRHGSTVVESRGDIVARATCHPPPPAQKPYRRFEVVRFGQQCRTPQSAESRRGRGRGGGWCRGSTKSRSASALGALRGQDRLSLTRRWIPHAKTLYKAYGERLLLAAVGGASLAAGQGKGAVVCAGGRSIPPLGPRWKVIPYCIGMPWCMRSGRGACPGRRASVTRSQSNKLSRCQSTPKLDSGIDAQRYPNTPPVHHSISLGSLRVATCRRNTCVTRHLARWDQWARGST